MLIVRGSSMQGNSSARVPGVLGLLAVQTWTAGASVVMICEGEPISMAFERVEYWGPSMVVYWIGRFEELLRRD